MPTGNPEYGTGNPYADHAIHPPCWWDTKNAKYGCRVLGHGPLPLEGDDMVPCRTCHAVTRNLRPQICDPCTVMFDAIEDQLATRPNRWLLKRMWLREAAA